MTPLGEVGPLLARVAMGDRAAFTRLFDQSAAHLFGICLRLLGDSTEAEETLQEVFATIWMRPDGHLADGLAPHAWLVTLTRDHALARRRAKARVPAAFRTADLLPGAETGPADASAGPQIRQCLDRLPRARAHLLRRAALDGNNYADLAEASGVASGTLRTWLRRSLVAVRGCLEQ